MRQVKSERVEGNVGASKKKKRKEKKRKQQITALKCTEHHHAYGEKIPQCPKGVILF